MKLSELANRLDTTPEDLVKYYHERQKMEISLDKDPELSYEIAKKADWKLTREIYENIVPFDENKDDTTVLGKIDLNKFIKSQNAKPIQEDKSKKEQINPNILANEELPQLKEVKVEKKIDLKNIRKRVNRFRNEEIKTEKIDIDEEVIKEYFSWSEKELINEILVHNQKDKLLLTGKYRPDLSGRNFGYFIAVKHEGGSFLDYPASYGSIDKVFVFSNKLERGKEYMFEVQIASKKHREERTNPFLIKAKTKTLKEVIELSELNDKIEEQLSKLTQLQSRSDNIEKILEDEDLKISNHVEELKQEKQKEANEVIEEYNSVISSKYEEIQSKEKQLSEIGDKLKLNSTKLTELTKKKNDMEASIEYLKQKLEICKNLEFISESDAGKYFDVINSSGTFSMPENHLSFIDDVEVDYLKLANHVHKYLYHEKGLIYTKYQIQNFLSLLMTHDIIILSGLSGSGKTQIVKSFAEAIGGVAKILPVKPNWTSSDDLLGYYNPIQSSFLPTPFTEAIVEAILNPNQLYFICLDEMNLARAEYYFADFLSKLEEREIAPEIELYAKHEEELFISEFGTLLSLMENAIDGHEIKSWQGFLSNDAVRQRFFDLLGTVEQETLLQVHSKMKRRLLGILKFPSSIKIPSNVRFIGAINVDETTHYFSPKILDRVHIMKFENPLLVEEMVSTNLGELDNEDKILPVYVNPKSLGERKPYPPLSQPECLELTNLLKAINKDFLLPLSIDFGIRSIRQSINYALQYFKTAEFDFEIVNAIILNTIINQKILPRFVFDGNETLKNGETKVELLERLSIFIEKKISIISENELEVYHAGYFANEYIDELISFASNNNGQINFYA